MQLTLTLGGQGYRVKLAGAIDLSMPLAFDGENVNCYWAAPPRSEVIRMGSFVGDTAEGGTVNYRSYTLTPHGNGTHTEGAAHIMTAPEAHVNRASDLLVPALVVTSAIETQPNGDRVVPLPDALPSPPIEVQAIIVRTIPNGDEKRLTQYSGTNPPYFHADWSHWLAAHREVLHLLVDLPSLDREDDGGALRTHRAHFLTDGQPDGRRTVTELIFVPDSLPDGLYLLNLQIPNWETDAAPSRVWVYPLEKV